MNRQCAEPYRAKSTPSIGRAILQRKCACGQHTGGRGCEGCRKKKQGLQRHEASGTEPAGVPAIVHEVLHSPGKPLDAGTRRFMEARFGRDFSTVRVHDDARAAASARAVNALAYAVGDSLVFGERQYSPASRKGRELLAHELTHVVQQTNAPRAAAERLTIGTVADRFEHEADAAARGIAGDESLGSSVDAGPLLIRRQPTGAQSLPAAPSYPGTPTPGTVEGRLTEEQVSDAGWLALGHALRSAGRDVGLLRGLYHRGEQAIAQEIARMRASGVPEGAIARRAAAMRTANALDVRRASGGILQKSAELLDRVRGNVARATYESLRAAGKTDAQIIESALRTNRFVNRVPSGLRWAGRGAWFVQAGISVYVVLSTPEKERARAATEEVGSFVGGLAGGAAVATLCLAAGLATGGIALIACGVLGAILGSAAGRAVSGAAYDHPQLLLGPVALPLVMPTLGMGAGGGFRGIMERDRQRMLETMRGGR